MLVILKIWGGGRLKLEGENPSASPPPHTHMQPWIHIIYMTSINSQVNEQANTDLQRIKGQIAYMKPDNFVSCQALLILKTWTKN